MSLVQDYSSYMFTLVFLAMKVECVKLARDPLQLLLYRQCLSGLQDDLEVR